MNDTQERALELADKLYRASTALREFAHNEEGAKDAFNAMEDVRIATSIAVASDFLMDLLERIDR